MSVRGGNTPWNAHHRPLSPRPNIGTRMPTARRSRRAVVRFGTCQRGDERHGDLDGEHRQHDPAHPRRGRARRAAGTSASRRSAPPGCAARRSRTTRGRRTHRSANSPIAVIAPTHCAAVEKTTAAVHRGDGERHRADHVGQHDHLAGRPASLVRTSLLRSAPLTPRVCQHATTFAFGFGWAGSPKSRHERRGATGQGESGQVTSSVSPRRRARTS